MYYLLETPEKFTDIKKLEEEDKKILPLPQSSMILLTLGFILIVGE